MEWERKCARQGELWKERGEAWKRLTEEWTLRIAENFKENKKTFWKGVNVVRKGEFEVVEYEKLD